MSTSRTRRKFSHVAHTRKIATPELMDAYAGILVPLMLLAELADDQENKPNERRLAAVEWSLKLAELHAAVGQAAREQAWAAQRPRAV